MSILVYKQRFRHPNKKDTPGANYAHVRYIATRPRVLKNENMNHGLFGKLEPGAVTEFGDWKDVAKLSYANSKKGIVMYRSVVSFAEDTAKELLLKDQKSWQRYMENHIMTIAGKNGIKRENLQWAAAVHWEKSHPPEYQNLTNVYWFVAEMCKAVGNKTPMQEYVKKLRPGHPARALLSISDVAPSRTKGSFYTSALTTLRLFTSRAVYSITHKSDYDIADIGKKKQALFFILPDEKTTYYPIASLMVSQLYELLVHQSDERGGRLINRVNFVLEEFGNFTKINDLTNKLTVAGGRGMRFHFFLQSFEQLTEKYNKETAAIVKSNCQSWIYLQADDKETLSEISDKLGKYTCSGYQLSSQHGRYVNPSSSSTVSLVARDLLTTDEIRRVSRPYQIVVSRSHPAMMVSPDLSQWYFNKMLGLGDKEHNRRVREERERRRPVLTSVKEDIPLWNIWVYYTKDLQMKEEKQKQQGLPVQAGTLFSEKFMRRGGKLTGNEEDE